MTRQSPLHALHQQAEALITPYGPDASAIPVVQTFGEIDLEYAALRKASLLLDCPQRATLQVAGADRIEFLHRMITQDVRSAAPFSVRPSFWLSRRGRIDADLRVIVLPDRVLLDVDAHAARRTIEGLAAYVIADDVATTDLTDRTHTLALHGPAARAVLDRVAAPAGAVAALEPGRAALVRIANAPVLVTRTDETGEIGLHLLVGVGPDAGAHADAAALPDAVRAVFDQLLEAGGFDAHHGPGPGAPHGSAAHSGPPPLVRPGGWAAFNVARVEAGTPIYHLDFGPDSLPHETSLVDSRVSFTKGCYLGQEIVARMQSLGNPKQRLVAIRLDLAQPAPTPNAADAGTSANPARPAAHDPTQPFEPAIVPQPLTGAALFALEPDALARAASGTPLSPADLGDAIGAVTSSVVSPMLGGLPVALAMVKFRHTVAGQRLAVECEGTLLPATVAPSLALWSRPR